MPKVLIVRPNSQYIDMFLERGWEVVESVSQADLIQFTGGADVDPDLYGHAKHPTTSVSPIDDKIDMTTYELAKRMNKPVAGICRGGQFLNVKSGGVMIQDCNGHALYGGHKAIEVSTGQEHHVTSTHHQMMHPKGKYKLLAYADTSTSKLLYDVESREFKDVADSVGVDIEAVFYEHTNALCFQPHPEFNRSTSTRDLYFKFLYECFGL